jgi:glycosyltransferase involved in cell wall biosynthesis
MRVLHVFPAFEVGGQQMRAATLANGMAGDPEFGHDGVHNLVLSLNGDMRCAERFADNVSWEAVSLPQQTSDDGGSTGRSPRGGLVRRLAEARRFVRSLNPDVLITYNWGAIEWAAANLLSSRVPGVKPVCRHIHVEDGFGPDEAQGQIARRALFRRLVLSGKASVAFPSRTLMHIAATIWRLPEDRLTYIPNGIDLEPYGSVTSEEARARFGLPRDRLVVGTLATLRPEKNLQRLIAAFGAVQEEFKCHLVIAGDGPERASLEALTRQLDLDGQVTFTGFVKEPHSLLPGFDIFALSSDTEQMPLSIIEAMASGVAIASLDVGDVGQMVAPQSAPYVRGRDKDALVASLTALLESPEIRRKTGLANKTLSRYEYSAQKMTSSWKHLFIHG